MTICVRCKHHSYDKKISKDSRWSHLCKYPGVQREEGIDPVTGEKCFFSKNDLGTMVTTSNKSPFCSSINTCGECEFFEEGERKWLKISTKFLNK